MATATYRSFPWALALTLTVSACVGCSRSKDAPSAASREPAPATRPGARLAVGETANTGDYRLTLKAVSRCAPPAHFAATTKSVRLGVLVTLVNASSGNLPLNPFYGHLEDAEGGRYALALAGCEPPLTARLLQPGEEAEGWLSFDVPVGSSALDFVYSPLTLRGDSPESRFGVGRPEEITAQRASSPLPAATAR